MPISSTGNAPFLGGCFFYPLNTRFRLFQDFFIKWIKNSASACAQRMLAGGVPVVLAAWMSFLPAVSQAVVSNDLHKMPSSSAANGLPSSSESAAAAISGSRYPGILDHLLISPEEDARDAFPLHVHINYPSTGVSDIDADIRSWVVNLADIFAKHLEVAVLSDSPTLRLDEADGFLQDNDLNIPQDKKSYELWGDYTVSRPSEKAISLTFEIWNYAGNPQGNLDILTLNYNLANNQRLALVDIFEKPDQALLLMSRYARNVLRTRLGPNGNTRMLQNGTEPLSENFASLTLTREGITVNFQPWQVAPWEAGIQKVEIPITELLAAEPLLSLWNM